MRDLKREMNGVSEIEFSLVRVVAAHELVVTRHPMSVMTMADVVTGDPNLVTGVVGAVTGDMNIEVVVPMAVAVTEVASTAPDGDAEILMMTGLGFLGGHESEHRKGDDCDGESGFEILHDSVLRFLFQAFQ